MKSIFSVQACSILLLFLKRKRSCSILFIILVDSIICCFIPLRLFSQSLQGGITGTSQIVVPNYQTDQNNKRNYKKQQTLISRFNKFGNISDNDSYWVTLCADVPDNNRPHKPYYKDACGHVFLIFTKISSSNDTTCSSFGYYPLHPDFSIFPLNIKSEIRDNSGREFDVKIEKKVNAAEFITLLETSVKSCIRKYNLKKYNCYDYALEVFNTIMKEKIPNHHIHLPLWIGKGGSPCSLYNDLEKMKLLGTPDETIITFGSLKSPKSKTIETNN